jgi:hypothetical protein
MAKKRGKYSRSRSGKLQPAVMQLNFVIPSGVSYLDLPLALSIANRRLYRQENTSYTVAAFELLSGGNLGQLVIDKLPETWVYDNAYQKTRALWHKMNDQVLDDEPSIKGRYTDFKILMEPAQLGAIVQTQSNPAGTILTPVQQIGGVNQFTNADFTGAVSPRADWEYSQLTIPNDPVSGTSTDYYISAVGASVVTKSCIEGYARSRSRPQSQDPNVPTNSGWMTELFDVGEQLEELRDIIENDNDRPPYPVSPEQTANDFYPGGGTEFPGLQTHGFCTFTSSTVSSKNTISGGVFQNGLIRFTNYSDGVYSLLLHMVPGTHRGYLCEAMD